MADKVNRNTTSRIGYDLAMLREAVSSKRSVLLALAEKGWIPPEVAEMLAEAERLINEASMALYDA